MLPTPRARSLARAAAAALAGALVAGSLAVAGVAPASAAKAPKVTVTAGDTRVDAVGGPSVALPDDVRTGVLTTLTTYLRTAATSTRAGAADATLAPLMTPAVAARLAGPDRGTLLDEGLPTPTGKVKVKVAPVTLNALADGTGAVVLVTAGLDATTTVPTRTGPVGVHRTGTLVLVPDNGTWKIQGYQLAVERTGKKLGTAAGTPVTTVAPAATGTTTVTVTK